MITMKDIAREVGTSQSTVSRVLNGNMSVNPEIRNKVMECVKKYNYKPNMLAQSLAANKSLLIGVIIPDISNPFFSDLVLAIESEAMKYGYSIILCNTDGNLAKEKYYINILSGYKVDGIIMVPRNIKDKFFLNLRKSSIPVVIATLEVDKFDYVTVSHYEAGQKVAKHLIDKGFDKFAFVGNVDDEKEKGFITGLKEAGYNLETDYRFIDISTKNMISEKLRPLTEDKEWKSNCGIFAMNDVIALIVLDALKEYKVKVPDEIGLIGFDNTFIGKEVTPSISSVAQPIEEIGKQSIEMLLEKMMNKNEKSERGIILDTKIISREATNR